MDSRYRYSAECWHCWNKSSATEFNGMSPFQPLLAIRPSSKEHQSTPYIQHRNMAKVTTDWASACWPFISAERPSSRCTKRDARFLCDILNFRGRDKEEQPDTFISQPHNSIKSKIHVVLGQSGTHLPLANLTILWKMPCCLGGRRGCEMCKLAALGRGEEGKTK